MLRRLLDSPWPYFIGAGLLLIAAIASQFEIRVPSRPVGRPADIVSLRARNDLNVVFILIDALRADRLGAYGYGRPTSQTMDALASRGILFKNALAQSSWTKTSMASLWTGTYPANNGVLRYEHVVQDAAVLPAEIFEKAGYRTAGIWRNGWVAPNFGFGQGFEFYLQPKAGREHQRVQSRAPGGRAIAGTDEDLVVSTSEFLDNFGREKFFLYLHFMDLHQYLYDEEAARFGTSYSDVYDQSIHWIDRLIGHILGKIDEFGGLANTLVLIASDHGEAFLEHGFEGHARDLHAEVVNVPLIIALPFLLDPGIVVEERVSNIDIWPTLLDLVGLPPLVNADGESLVPLILSAAGAGPADDSFRRPVMAQLDRRWGQSNMSEPLVSVTDGDLRMVWWVKRPERGQLFNLAEDPAELKNLFRDDDPESQRLLQMARQHYESGRSPWGVEPKRVELDELRLNQLRALGYVIR
jgi:arylsulfatase A-like enzyme